MPRVRAADYGDKKNGILDAAAALFADSGYAGCKMEDIAKACSVSKSMLYHYFKKKEDILYQILRERLMQIIEALEQYEPNTASRQEVDQRFYKLVESYLEKSKAARSRHVVALHDRRYLTTDQHSRIIKLERRILELMAAFLRGISTGYSDVEYRAYGLLFIGMVNWVEMWYRSSGKISPEDLYAMITKLFLHGFVGKQPAVRRAALR